MGLGLLTRLTCCCDPGARYRCGLVEATLEIVSFVLSCPVSCWKGPLAMLVTGVSIRGGPTGQGLTCTT